MDTFEAYRDRELDLDGLVQAAAGVLAGMPSSPADGRVREDADARTVRYYQTLGILDKPIRYDGRRAVYGYRHLLQVVAVKFLQTQGLKLEQIQRAMVRASTSELESTLASALGRAGEAPQKAEPASFPPSTVPPITPIHRITELYATSAKMLNGAQRSLYAEEVAPGVTVVIDPRFVSDPEDVLQSIRGLMRAKKGGAA